MFALDLCRARLEYALKTVSPLHVGAGGPGPQPLSTGKTEGTKARGPGYALRVRRPGDMGTSEPINLPVHTFDAAGRQCFFVPGSSIRGALRAALHDRLARVLDDLALQNRVPVDPYRREGQTKSGADVNPDLTAGHLLVRMLFGTEQRRGQLAVGPAEFPKNAQVAAESVYSDRTIDDLCERQVPPPTRTDRQGHVAPPARNARLRLLTQVRLDRATQASGDGLRTFAALAENQELRGAFELRNFAFWQLGLLALAEQAANAGSLRLGAKTGVGLGQVEIHFTRLDLTWHARVAPAPTDALYGIGVAAQKLGLIGPNGLPVPPESDRAAHTRGRRLLGQDGDPEKGTPPSVSLWLVDPQDRAAGVTLGELTPVAAAPLPEAGGPLAAFAQRAYTSDRPDVIARVLRAGADRTLAAFQLSFAAPSAAEAVVAVESADSADPDDSEE